MKRKPPSSSSHAHLSARSLARRKLDRSGQGERGFTLIELLIVVTIIPLIIGALAAGLITVFSLQTSVSNRLGDSGDAEVVAASFTKDVQSASSITTDPTITSPTSNLPFCGSGTLLLGLEWGSGKEVVSTEAASYVEQQFGPTSWELVRNDCASGPWTTPTGSTVLSYDMLPPCPVTDTAAMCSSLHLQPAPIAYDGPTVIVTSTGLVSTSGMTSLQFPILEPKSSYVYHLSAAPVGGASTSPTNMGAPKGSGCGFAQAGTGQYATTMCFIGFTTAEIQAAFPNAGNTCTSTDPGQQGLDMSVGVPGGYVMSFCLTVVPGENQGATNPPPVVAVSTPVGGGTCGLTQCDAGHISNGQGFLGNDNQVNGAATPFYSAIGCPVSTPTLQNNVVTSSCIDPAIFQTSSGGNDTVTLSNIVVNDPEGDLATGYEVITADAETIDPGGYIKWTSSLPAPRPLPFNLVPNFSNSDLGNACNNVPTADAGAGNPTGWSIDDGDATVQIGGTNYSGDLTGLGSASVECTSNWQTTSPYLRTGTAMLGITPPTVNGGAEPVTISAQLQGEGYNAVAFGLLLP